MNGKVLRRLGPLAVTFCGERHSGWLPAGASTPLDTPAETVVLEFEVVELGSSSYLLQWRPATGQAVVDPPYAGDTWHASLEDALHQAELDFGIAPDEWS